MTSWCGRNPTSFDSTTRLNARGGSNSWCGTTTCHKCMAKTLVIHLSSATFCTTSITTQGATVFFSVFATGGRAITFGYDIAAAGCAAIFYSFSQSSQCIVVAECARTRQCHRGVWRNKFRFAGRDFFRWRLSSLPWPVGTSGRARRCFGSIFLPGHALREFNGFSVFKYAIHAALSGQS